MRIQLLPALAAVLVWTGCSQGTENEVPDPNSKVALHVSAGIQTRAHDATWEANDAIGIYMVKTGTTIIEEGAENRRYSTPDGSSGFSTQKETTIYFPVDGSRVDFLVYYPYQETLVEGELTLDVSNQTDLSAIDLMTAKVQSTDDKPVDKMHPTVAFNFAHILTKLELNITAGNGVTSDDLKGLNVEITNQRIEGSYDPQYEVYGTLSEPVKTIALNTNAAGTLAQAILLPNDTGGNSIIEGREFVFTLASSGEVFKWSIPDEKAFKRGDKNLYNITLNRTGLDVTATITDWNKGNGESGDDASAE